MDVKIKGKPKKTCIRRERASQEDTRFGFDQKQSVMDVSLELFKIPS